MKIFVAFMLQVFLRPLTLGLAYETVRVWFPTMPTIPWLNLWGIVVLVGLATSGSGAIPETDEDRISQLANQAIFAAVFRLVVVFVVWAVVT